MTRKPEDVLSTTVEGENLSALDEDAYYDYDSELVDLARLPWEKQGLLVIFAACFLLGVGGNIYLGVRKHYSGAKRTLYEWCMMATDGLLLCLVLPLIAIAIYRGEWQFGTFVCKTVNYALLLALGMSALSLVVGSCEFLFSERSSSKRRWCSEKGVAIFAWAAVALASIPVAVYTSVDHHWEAGKDKPFCHQPHESNTTLKLYLAGIFSLFYIFPVGTTALVLISANACAKQDEEQEPENMSVAASKSGLEEGKETRASLSRSLIAGLLVFTVCRLPTHITQITELYASPGSVSLYWLSLTAQALFFFNCAINPLVQVFTARNGRQDFIPLRPATETLDRK